MQIAQISDCHVVANGGLVYGRVDTLGLLRKAIAAIKCLPRCPDLIVVTGDLTQNGLPEEYSAFLDATQTLKIPVAPVVGNHDDSNNLIDAFKLGSRFELQTGFVQYAIENLAVRVLVLDSTTPGSADGSFCRARLSWLDSKLKESSRPTLIAMHHPPFPVGVSWMEPKVPGWGADLAGIIGHHKNVRVTCGHVHRSMSRMWAGICVTVAPSTAHQVFPDLTPNGAPRFDMEAPGFILHDWSNGEGVAYGISIPGLDDKFDARGA
jgi:Icc protein